jgi:hypothetical protein
MVEPVDARTSIWDFSGRNSPLKTKNHAYVCSPFLNGFSEEFFAL